MLPQLHVHSLYVTFQMALVAEGTTTFRAGVVSCLLMHPVRVRVQVLLRGGPLLANVALIISHLEVHCPHVFDKVSSAAEGLLAEPALQVLLTPVDLFFVPLQLKFALPATKYMKTLVAGCDFLREMGLSCMTPHFND